MEQLQTAEARRFQHTVCRQQLSSACEKVLQVGERDGVQTMAEQGMQEVAAVRLRTSMCSVRLVALAMYGCLGSGRGG